MRQDMDIRSLRPGAVRLLWQLHMFCAEYEGKCISYVSRRSPHGKPKTEKGLVTGHDGPRWHAERGWYVPSMLGGGLGPGGWGCVVILQSAGTRHFTDPSLLDEVREIRRDDLMNTAYEAEAVDLFCPYGCDADGLTDWDENWSGPEYEVFCPVHRAAAWQLGHDLYHRPEDFDGSDLEA